MEDPQDRPFIEAPDETTPPKERLYCFLDAGRPCGAECMAFLPVRPEGPDYASDAWPACMLLVNLHKLGKHHVSLAQTGVAMLKQRKDEKVDAARASIGQTLPPPVR